MLNLNTWVFLALGTDVSENTQYGFRYVLGASPSIKPTAIFKTRSPSSGTFYALTAAGVFHWTNKDYNSHCSCKMRYLRLYTDFVPYNQDMMISLALMDRDSNTL